MIHFKLTQYLLDRGYLQPGSSIMDVGTQNLLFVEEAPAIALVRRLRTAPLGDRDIEEIRRICHFSFPRPNERTTFLHELLALTDVHYDSIDVVDGLKTTIMDLNVQSAPSLWIKRFDLVINCGTLEHVINQHNALTFIHDILKVGGLWFDQPPSVGFLNHGYFNYNPLFYRDLAHANHYEVLEAWYCHAGSYAATDVRFPIIDVNHLDQDSERAKTTKKPFSETHVRAPEMALSYNFNVTMRKTLDAPLRLPLEVRTTHGPVKREMRTQYGESVFESNALK